MKQNRLKSLKICLTGVSRSYDSIWKREADILSCLDK